MIPRLLASPALLVTFASVLPTTTAGYIRAVRAFLLWVRLMGRHSLTLSDALGDYVYWCYDTQEVSKYQVQYLLSGLAILRPRLKANGSLAIARRRVGGWTQLKPSKSHLPIPRPILLACAVELHNRGYCHVAGALLLGFECYLRHSELRLLRVSVIAFQETPASLWLERAPSLSVQVRPVENSGSRFAAP